MENKIQNKIENETENKTHINKEIAIDLMQKPEIDSDRFFKLIDSSVQGSRECRLISSAFELGVFETLKIPLSAGTLAEKLGCDPVLMPHFCEALCTLGLLDRFVNGSEDSFRDEKTKKENTLYMCQSSVLLIFWKALRILNSIILLKNSEMQSSGLALPR
jgi:hypothetical protein